MAAAGEIALVGSEGSRQIHWLGSRGTFFATSAETAGAFSLWMDEPPPGGGPVPHVHLREEEFFYVLEGNLTYWCAGQAFSATPGAFIGLPKGLGHQFRNEGPGPSRILIGFIPGGGEGAFLEIGNPYSEPEDASLSLSPEQFGEIAARYGQVIAAPSPSQPSPSPSSVDQPLGIGRAPILREPGVGEMFAAEGVLVTLKAVSPQTLGAYSLAEIEVMPGEAFPAHRHPRYAEGLYVIEGELSLQAGGAKLSAGPGSFAWIPPGAVHALANAGNRAARVLSVTTPGGIEEFYRAACRPLHDHPAGPAIEGAGIGRLAELGPQFGIEFA